MLEGVSHGKQNTMLVLSLFMFHKGLLHGCVALLSNC